MKCIYLKIGGNNYVPVVAVESEKTKREKTINKTFHSNQKHQSLPKVSKTDDIVTVMKVDTLPEDKTELIYGSASGPRRPTETSTDRNFTEFDLLDLFSGPPSSSN